MSKKYSYNNNNNYNNNNYFSNNYNNNNAIKRKSPWENNNFNDSRKRKFPWENNNFNNNNINNSNNNNNNNKSSIHLSLAVYNTNEISIHVARTNIPKIQLYFSSMEQAHYSQQELCWIVPLEKYSTVLNDAKIGKIIPGSTIKIEEIPDFVLNAFSNKQQSIPNFFNTININNNFHTFKTINNSNNDNKNNIGDKNVAKLMEERIPKNLLSKLMRFQYLGVREAILKNGRVFLCDEMGLGMY